MEYMLPVFSEFAKTYPANFMPSHRNTVTLIVGKNKSCKSSLLFQAAVTHAAEGHHVVYISHEPLTRIPLHVHGMPAPDANLLKELKMLYMKTGEELIEYLSCLHDATVVPDVLLIDDIHHYITQLQDGDGERTLAKICAMLTDAAAFMKLKSGDHAKLVSTMEVEAKNYLAVLHRFVKSVFYISELEEADNRKFQLQLTDGDSMSAKNKNKKETIEITIRDNQLLLDKVIVETT